MLKQANIRLSDYENVRLTMQMLDNITLCTSKYQIIISGNIILLQKYSRGQLGTNFRLFWPEE